MSRGAGINHVRVFLTRLNLSNHESNMISHRCDLRLPEGLLVLDFLLSMRVIPAVIVCD